MSSVSVIIVSWNVCLFLRQSLLSAVRENPREIIVIDNNSQDGSVEMVKREFPNVTLLRQSANLGFARAVNIGISKSTGDILLLLNPDASLKQQSLATAESFFENHPQAGVMGGKILEPDGKVQRSVRQLPTVCSQLVVLLKLNYLLPSLLNKYLMEGFDYKKSTQVEQVSGALFFTRRLVIDKVGYFDEKFWLWFEEVDFCARAIKAGWQVWYCPQVEAIHKGGASFSQLNHWRRQRQFNKSLLYYFKIHGHIYARVLLWLASKVSRGQAAILDLTRKVF